MNEDWDLDFTPFNVTRDGIVYVDRPIDDFDSIQAGDHFVLRKLKLLSSS